MAALASDCLRNFRLLLWNYWKELNETCQEARPQRPLQSLCFIGSIEKKNKMAGLASDGWVIFDIFSETTERNSTKLDRKQDLNVLYHVCVLSGWIEKQDGGPGLWLSETFSTSLKPLNGIQWKLTGSKISTSSTKFVFFGPIGKTRWSPWPLIGWDIFDFFSETAEWNSTKTWQEVRSQRPLLSLCFWVDRKNKMAALASDWLRHFRLLLRNRWTEFNKTWQEARPQRPLPSLCFSGRSEIQDGRPDLWLAETFSTSPLKSVKRIQQNLIGCKISTSSTKFVFFGSIGKTRWPPWPLIDWYIFDFFSETSERNSMKLDRKQDLNVLYQIVFFGPIGNTRWPSWPLIGWDIFDFSSEIGEGNSTKLNRMQDLNVLY